MVWPPHSDRQTWCRKVIIKLHKMGYFYADTITFEEIAKRTGTFDNNQFTRHPLTYLLESADDIAYSTADLENGFKKGMFTLEELIEFLDTQYRQFCNDQLLNDHQKKYTDELFKRLVELKNNPTKGTNITKDIKDVNLYALQNWVIYVQNWFIYCASFGFQDNYDQIMDGTYKKDLLYGTNHQYSMKILKNAMKEFIFPDKSIVKLELAAKTIISSLLDKFVPAIIYFDCPNKNGHSLSKADEKLIGLLSKNYLQNYYKEAKHTNGEEEKLYLRLLLITDFISGMTDSYAKTLYQELTGIY